MEMTDLESDPEASSLLRPEEDASHPLTLLTDSPPSSPNLNNPNYNELIRIVKEGQAERLKRLIEQNQQLVNSFKRKSETGNTVLHHAVCCRIPSKGLEMTKIILSSLEKRNGYRDVKSLIDMPNTVLQTVDPNWRPSYFERLFKPWMSTAKRNEIPRGDTALLLASKNGRSDIVQILLAAGANMTIKNQVNKTALDYIFLNIPQAFETFYDTLVEYKKEGGIHCFEEIQLDFENVIMVAEESDSDMEKLRETEVLGGLLKKNPRNFRPILQHPLVELFIHIKYEQAYTAIMTSIIFHICWYLIFAYFIFDIYFLTCPWKQRQEILTPGNASVEMDWSTGCNGDDLTVPGIPLAVFVSLLAIIFLPKEIFEICTVPSFKMHFFQLKNIGQLFGILTVVPTSLPIYQCINGTEQLTIAPWQYKLAAVSIFIQWALLLGQVCKLRSLRIYIEIFVKVFKSFTMFICTFGSLLLGFASAFCIIMPEAKAFSSPWLAIPKLLSMMTGELNYDEVFHNDNQDSLAQPSNYLSAQLLFSLFTIFMVMILINLLIGLAVSDTQELKKHCRAAELSSMLEDIYLLESFAVRLKTVFRTDWLLKRLSIFDDNYRPSTISPKVPEQKDKMMMCPDSGSNNLQLTSSKFSMKILKSENPSFPAELIDRIRDLAKANYEKELEGNNIEKTMLDYVEVLSEQLNILRDKISRLNP